MWNNVIDSLRISIGKEEFESWIEPIKFLSTSGNVLQLSVPSPFIRDYLSKHHKGSILSTWNQCSTPNVLDVEIIVNLTQPKSTKTIISNDTTIEKIVDSFLDETSKLNPEYTFENFVVGEPNKLAYVASKKVAEGENNDFNPLFIYGGTGLGKTHLMHAIANYSKVIAPKRKVIYISAEQFVYRFVQSIRDKTGDNFKNLFRKVDVLMVDDVQFIGGKEASQEEFFHTFNALIDSGKQIVLSSDRPPSELKSMEKRLISRMQKGLVADIHKTSYELRLGILQKKVEIERNKNPNVFVPADVLSFLAMKITSNVRELEGAFKRLIVLSEILGRPIDVDNAQEDLKDILKSNLKEITVDDIQNKVCEYYKIKFSDMTSSNRARQVSLPRQIAMYITKDLTTLSLPEIGRRFGGRDHSTVIHAIDKIKKEQVINSQISEDLRILLRILEN